MNMRLRYDLMDSIPQIEFKKASVINTNTFLDRSRVERTSKMRNAAFNGATYYIQSGFSAPFNRIVDTFRYFSVSIYNETIP